MFKQDNLNDLVLYYTLMMKEKFKQEDLFNNFDSLFKFCSPIDEWLVFHNDKKILKNNSISTEFRTVGNRAFIQNNYDESLENYTRSLCYAEQYSEEFCLSLANRSAVTFAKGFYEECLEDIELCLNSLNYPERLKPKVLLRKADCLKKLNRKEDFQNFVEKVRADLAKSSENQEKYLVKLNELVREEVSKSYRGSLKEIIPVFDEKNSEFINASKKIKMVFNETKGRHVIAKQNILKGDIIFIEKAFVSTQIFNEETAELDTKKCHHCLKSIFNGIPCGTCVECVFCNNDCKNSSWLKYHKYECVGFQMKIWYHLGISQIAYRAFLQGFHSNQLEKNVEFCNFIDENESYLYFNSLTYHFPKEGIDHLILSAVLMRYLQKYTDLLKDISFDNIKRYGGLIAKHILQLSNNGSIIEHYTLGKKEDELPESLIPVASGIFPSVSMMNHSCKSNICYFFIRDTIVVKALDDIKKNEEIFNCYGIDFRTMSREERQEHCMNRYNFECNCEICLDSSKEFENYNQLKCIFCGNSIRLIAKKCNNCGKKIDSELYDEVLFGGINENDEKLLLKSCEKIHMKGSLD